MAVLPNAYAASLLRRDDAGRMVFFPDGDDKSSYVIPDVETEQRIFRQLKRIRFAQLAAWVLLPVVFITVIVVTEGVLIPKWLFISGVVIVMLVIQLLPEWARQGLARDLIVYAEPTSEPSLIERLPAWAIIPLIALAFGLALYFGRTWPLSAFAWFDDIAHLLAGWKGLATVAAMIGGAAAMLWGGIGALRKWFRSSTEHTNPVGSDEEK